MKWSKIVRSGKKWSSEMHQLVGSGQNGPQVAENGQKYQKMAKNGQKWLDVDESGWKCSEEARNRQ